MHERRKIKVSKFPGAATSATVQYVVHSNSTVTCALIGKGYALKLILGQRNSLAGWWNARAKFGTQDSELWIPRLRPHTLYLDPTIGDLSAVGNLAA